MPITPACNPADIVVSVKTSVQEYLLYNITAQSGADYTLESDPGGTLCSSAACPSPCQYKWPPIPTPAGSDFKHTLGIGFSGQSRLEYVVEHCTSAGQRIKIVKSCVYTGGPGQYYEPLKVRTL
jgi:hypothetical protein